MDTLKFQYLKKDKVTADVTVDFSTKTVTCQTYTDDNLATPFGCIKEPTIEDFNHFLESRCFPEARFNAEELLADLGLEYYSPLNIVRKTHGRQLEDYCWIRFDGEELDYEKDIKLRD